MRCKLPSFLPKSKFNITIMSALVDLGPTLLQVIVDFDAAPNQCIYRPHHFCQPVLKPWVPVNC
jgi:hypothetical protein